MWITIPFSKENHWASVSDRFSGRTTCMKGLGDERKANPDFGFCGECIDAMYTQLENHEEWVQCLSDGLAEAT